MSFLPIKALVVPDFETFNLDSFLTSMLVLTPLAMVGLLPITLIGLTSDFKYRVRQGLAVIAFGFCAGLIPVFLWLTWSPAAGSLQLLRHGSMNVAPSQWVGLVVTILVIDFLALRHSDFTILGASLLTFTVGFGFATGYALRISYGDPYGETLLIVFAYLYSTFAAFAANFLFILINYLAIRLVANRASKAN